MEKQAAPDNYMVWAILCTILCCTPLGIVSIVYASKVNTLYNAGEYVGAYEASQKAKKFAIYGAVMGFIMLPVIVALNILSIFVSNY
jgi:hypothetical protein